MPRCLLACVALVLMHAWLVSARRRRMRRTRRLMLLPRHPRLLLMPSNSFLIKHVQSTWFLLSPCCRCKYLAFLKALLITPYLSHTLSFNVNVFIIRPKASVCGVLSFLSLLSLETIACSCLRHAFRSCLSPHCVSEYSSYLSSCSYNNQFCQDYGTIRHCTQYLFALWHSPECMLILGVAPLLF